MLKHRNEQTVSPRRVVILGAKGFVGGAIAAYLAKININTLAIGREEIDLSKKNAAEKLTQILHPDDALIVIAARAPCKSHNMLLENMQIMTSVCDALKIKRVQQVIYISSDAVYSDSMGKLSEQSPAAPSSLHGAMHLAREHMLKSVVDETALLIIRPSLLYGVNDPHNGYGPNSFYRLVQAAKPIALFGQGEELRDHVYIDDVAQLIYLSLTHHSYGVLNITTGEVISFYQIAELLNQFTSNPVNILFRTRNAPMPHNGYRAFDNSLCQQAFPNFQYTPLLTGLNKMHQMHEQKNQEHVDARN